MSGISLKIQPRLIRALENKTFPLMTAEQLRVYARLFAEMVIKVSNNRLDDVDDCG
ncbi:6050_t:CDS:2 [Paraglomus brasilianum]|uniref:6050_t:CDS:1 n=1 Tax=Paraglomus brasilianum TaxID=144538 RepID=A0A9N9E6E5_9GLOM|nr:6050_t:CDS:2 [Paraglomus brasilianum]